MNKQEKVFARRSALSAKNITEFIQYESKRYEDKNRNLAQQRQKTLTKPNVIGSVVYIAPKPKDI